MDTTRAEQIALDDALVAPANRLKIGKTDVPEIYMQEFWATATVHHHSIRFKMNNKKHIVNLEYFREMLQICPKLPNQQFEELPFEEAILTFLRDLGHSGEDFVYQVENKNVKKSNEMYYPRFTNVIINFFMAKDQSIPRRNSVNWHYARDDYMFTTIKELNLQKKASVKKKQIGTNTTITSSTTKGKRLKTSAKTAKPAKKKQPAKTSMDKGADEGIDASGSGADKGTGAISGVPNVPTYNSDDEQISWKSSDEEDDDEVSLNDDDDDEDDDDVDNQDDDNQDDDDQEHDDQDDEANDDAQDKDDQDDENQYDDNEQTDLDNNGDDLVHPKFSTHDEEERDEESFDPRVQTPSHVESTDDEDDNEEVQSVNIEGEEIDEEANSEESEGNELYRDQNVSLEGRDVEMTDAQPTNVQTTQVTKDTYATLLVDVPVTTFAEPPFVSATTLPPPPTLLITHMQQTPVPIPTTIPSSSLQDLSNFGSLFGFDHQLKTLETDFFEFKQTNHFAEAVSSILGIVDAYLANKMHEAVKTAVQLQSKTLRDEAQAENADFLNKLDDNIKKIIKD
ncbi:hypothetical protein Tco_0798077 [Tanacetum coccineum]